MLLKNWTFLLIGYLIKLVIYWQLETADKQIRDESNQLEWVRLVNEKIQIQRNLEDLLNQKVVMHRQLLRILNQIP
jgi:ABC-type phosphate transport system auxiliary subunit